MCPDQAQARQGVSRDTVELLCTGLHPTSPERYLGMEQHIREIKGKLAADMPLVPDGVEETAPAPR